MKKVALALGVLCLFLLFLLLGQTLDGETRGVENGQKYGRLIIRNVIVIDGKGTPPRGPLDIIVEGNKIQSVQGASRDGKGYEKEEHVLDGTGMYLLPGLINIHAHLQDSRGGIALPFEYSYKLWLACGITTIRDVGSDYEKTLEERRKSQEGLIAAPRIFLYMTASGRTPDEIRQGIQEAKKKGADGIKLFALDRDIMKAALDEAHKLSLRVAHHVAVEETDAWDDAEFGVTSIEHWYGIPDAALHGSQDFPRLQLPDI